MNKKLSAVPFVFGSSTPRELSHHSDDCAKKGLKAKLDTGGADGVQRRGDTLYYMRQAKTTDMRKESRSGAGGVRARAAVAYAFGSSTPRSLSHMSKVPREQRVYDAKLAKQQQRPTTVAPDGLRASTTNPQLSGNRPKRWTGVGGRSVSIESQNEGDEAASEPDFVQDRMADFTRNIGAAKRAASGTPKRDSTTKTTEDGRGRPKAKISTGTANVPPNGNRKKPNSGSTTIVQNQQQQQQKGGGGNGGDGKWEDGAVTAPTVDEHHQTAAAVEEQVQAVQRGHQNDAAMGMLEEKKKHKTSNNNGEEEEEMVENGGKGAEEERAKEKEAKEEDKRNGEERGDN